MAIYLLLSGIIGCLLLILLLPSHVILTFFNSSNEMKIPKHVQKSKDNLTFPASSIATALLTPENSPYTSKTATPMRHTPSQSISEDSHVYKRLFNES